MSQADVLNGHPVQSHNCVLNTKLMYKNLVLLAVVFGLTIKCTSPTYELKGVVQDGLNGGAIAGVEVAIKGAGLSVLTDDKGEFLLKVLNSATPGVNLENGGPAYDIVLIAGKSGTSQVYGKKEEDV